MTDFRKHSLGLAGALVLALAASVSCSKLAEESKSTKANGAEDSQAAGEGGFELAQPDLGDLRGAEKINVKIQESAYCSRGYEGEASTATAEESSDQPASSMGLSEQQSLVACSEEQGRVVVEINRSYKAGDLIRVNLQEGVYLVTLNILDSSGKVMLTGKAKATVDQNGNGKANIELSRGERGGLIISASIMRDLPVCYLPRKDNPCIEGFKAQCFMDLRDIVVNSKEPMASGGDADIKGPVACNLENAKADLYKLLCANHIPRVRWGSMICSVSTNPMPTPTVLPPVPPTPPTVPQVPNNSADLAASLIKGRSEPVCVTNENVECIAKKTAPSFAEVLGGVACNIEAAHFKLLKRIAEQHIDVDVKYIFDRVCSVRPQRSK